MKNNDGFITAASIHAEIEARMTLDAYERAQDMYELMTNIAESEGKDPETDFACNQAKSRLLEARIAYHAMVFAD